MNFYISIKITDWLIMAKITLKNLSHSYLTKQNNNGDWALRGVDIDWKDGGAYALLGPSGCGKTTLLNIISGLLKPTKGEVLFLSLIHI